MITFGYKSKFSSILRACAAVGIGLVMIMANNATVTVVKIIAAFLFAAGVVSFAHGIAKREGGSLPLMSFNAAVDMIIGALLFVFPQSVANFIPQIIGICLLGFGILQLVVLSGAMSILGSGFASLILSIIILIGGITLIFSPLSMGVMRLFAGISLIVYGVSELVSMYRMSKAQEAYEIKFGPSARSSYADSQNSDAEKETYSNGPIIPDQGKLDTSGISDAKEVEYTKED